MHSARTRREKLTPIPYLLPALVSMAVLSFFPIAYTIWISFTNSKTQNIMSGYKFIGIQNYLDIINGSWKPIFLPILAWTLVFTFLSVATQYGVGLFLATLLNNKHMKESNFYRALLIIPWTLPSALMIMSFKALLNTDYGQANLFLTKFLHMAPIPWLTDPAWARVSTILVNLWFGFPWFMIVLLGGLQAIPTDFYEAAEIDGATRGQQFRLITLPILWSVSLPVVISSLAFNFNNFGAAYLLTGGGPPRASAIVGGYTDILASVGFKLVNDSQLYGIASALSVLLFICVAIFSLINMRYTNAFQEVD